MKHHKIKILILFIGIFLETAAQDTLKLVGGNYPPWRMVQNGQLTGIDIDIWKEIAQSLDIALELKIANSLNHHFEMIKSGEADVAVGLLKTPEREQFFQFMEVPYKVKRKISFYVRKGEAHTIMKQSDLSGKKIGMNRSYGELAEKISDAKEIITGNLNKSFSLLNEGKLDAVMGTDWISDYHLAQSNPKDVYEKAGYYFHLYNDLHPYFFGFSKKSKFLSQIDEIEENLETLIENGTVSGIINKYLTDYHEYFDYASPEDVGMSTGKLSQIKGRVQEWVDQEQIVGARFLVLRNNKIVLNESVGWADKENKVPMYPNHIFRMGSMTKPLTGAAIQMLIEDGKLQLSDKVSKYIPDFRNNKSGDITIFQLLTHTSGLPADKDYYKRFKKFNSLGEAIREVALQEPETKPGTAFLYSSLNSSVLGYLIEAITGKPAEIFIQERILDPLGMNNSFCTLQAGDNRKSKLAACYLKKSGEWSKQWNNSMEMPMHYFTGATGFYSTATDYARFLGMMMQKGVFQEKQVLSPASVRLATKAHSCYVYDEDFLRNGYNRFGNSRYYGLNWWVYDDKYIPIRDCFSPGTFEIQGMWATCAFVDPEEKLIGIFLTQSARSWGVFWKKFPNMVYGALLNGK